MTQKSARWWLEEQIRMVQTNLREIDGSLDPKAFVSDVQAMDGNVVLFNAGGIQANYPTDLPYHEPNPYVKGDLLGAVLSECKAAGIRLIARFDFSKAAARIYEERPEWFYIGQNGEPVNYNGVVHTCINGYYQKVYALEILREVLDRYEVDGVFFNMFGYQTTDYSGNYHGICRCAGCREAFRAYSGMELPVKEDRDDPVFRRYDQLRRETVRERLDAITEVVKGYGDHLAICTYTTHNVDIVRSESMTKLHEPHQFLYDASDNTRSVTASWPDKAASNAAVHFIYVPYRHIGVSPHLTELRLVQTMANGGGLDWFVMGTLGDQADRSWVKPVSRWFSYFRKHEDLYRRRRPAANVALMAYNRSHHHRMPEYQGVYRILSEEHILFHNLDPEALERRPKTLRGYDLVILAGPIRLTQREAALYDAYVEAGGRLLVLQEALPAEYDAKEDVSPLASLGAGRIVQRRVMDGAYLQLKQDPQDDVFGLSGYQDLDLCFVHGSYRYADLRPGARGIFRLIPKSMYGPPEKCYYETAVDRPGVIVNDYGQGRTAYVPWNLGALYDAHSWPGHRRLFVSIVESILGIERFLTTTAPESVEVTLLTPGGRWMDTSGHWLLQLVNLSGRIGGASFRPVPVEGIDIRIRTPKTLSKVTTVDGAPLETVREGAALGVRLPRLDLLAGVVVRFLNGS